MADFLRNQRNGRVFTTKRLIKMKLGNLTLAAVVSLLFLSQVRVLNADFKDCSGKLAPGDLQRCEDMFARNVAAGSRTSQLAGGWRLVKTPDPRGGPDAVSVLHAADTIKSDLNFAGLTFRCGRAGIETLLILLEPLALGSQYVVRVKGGATENQFEAKALQRGEVLLLPPSATALAGGAWQSAPELAVVIAAPSPIRGSVALDGLSGALSTLSQSCPAR
jgi:hypothetical protein